ncbi:MAG: hypothetical protein IJS45_03100 [Clostridia bacterium]|nr:hypothetical protein [Clostridia bacterium]
MKNDTGTDKISKRIRVAIAWCFITYAMILFGERIASISRVIANGVFFASGFDSFVNVTASLSLICAAVMLAALPKNRGLILSLAGVGDSIDYDAMSLTCGVLLVSGMLHTEYTFAPVQFAAYGFLIAAMVIKTADTARRSEHRFKLWYTLIYLVAFSMAIPVMYRSSIELATLFHVVEGISALALVALFTRMMRAVFKERPDDLIGYLPFVAMVVFDAAVLFMRWSEEINTFVLIFASAAASVFIVGKIIFAVSGKKSEK